MRRLLLPTYIFLVAYFALLFFCNKIPEPSVVLKSFLLQNDSIGYVWIIRVYLMCAIIVPIASKVDLSKRVHCVIVLMVYILYELICELQIGTSFRLVESTLYYVIPYGIVLILGLNYNFFSRQNKIYMAIFFTLAFA